MSLIKKINIRKESLLFLPEKDYSDILNDYSLHTINMAANSVFRPIYEEIENIICNFEDSVLINSTLLEVLNNVASELKKTQSFISPKMTVLKEISDGHKEQSKLRKDHCVSSCLSDILPKSVFSLSSDILKSKNISFYYENKLRVDERYQLDAKATISSKIITADMKLKILPLAITNIKSEALNESGYIKKISPNSFHHSGEIDKKTFKKDFSEFINQSVLSSFGVDFNQSFYKFLILSEFSDIESSLINAAAIGDLICNNPIHKEISNQNIAITASWM